MLPLTLAPLRRRPLRVLCLGAHSDDIEIGCGGLILSLLASLPDVEFDWVVFSAPPAASAKRVAALELFLQRRASTAQCTRRSFATASFPIEGAAIKEAFETLKRRSMPDLVLTHYRDDRHQDHRVLSDLTWNTFRDHWSSSTRSRNTTATSGRPTVFVPLDRRHLRRKVELSRTRIRQPARQALVLRRDVHGTDAVPRHGVSRSGKVHRSLLFQNIALNLGSSREPLITPNTFPFPEVRIRRDRASGAFPEFAPSLLTE